MCHTSRQNILFVLLRWITLQHADRRNTYRKPIWRHLKNQWCDQYVLLCTWTLEIITTYTFTGDGTCDKSSTYVKYSTWVTPYAKGCLNELYVKVEIFWQVTCNYLLEYKNYISNLVPCHLLGRKSNKTEVQISIETWSWTMTFSDLSARHFEVLLPEMRRFC